MAAWRRVLFSLILLLSSAGARAQSVPDTVAARAVVLPPDTIVALPGVTVGAARLPGETPAASRRVTVLDREAIAAVGARSMAGVLQARTGLFVKRYGASGPATASLRGAGAGQTLVLLDGYRMADPQTGRVDLSLLPAVLVRAVEVVHGAGGAHYGSGSLGGVVRLHTLAPTDALRLRLRGAAGAFGRRSLGAVVSGGGERLAGLAAVKWGRAAGDFPYVNETLVPPRTVRRRNADRALQTFFGEMRYDAAHRRLRLTAWYNRVERGLPGTANTNFGREARTRGPRQWNENLRLTLRSMRRYGWGVVQIDGSAQWAASRYLNPRAQLQVGDTTRTQRYALEATARAPIGIGRRGFVAGGVQAGLDRAALRGGVRRWRWAPFLRAEAVYGRFTFAPALRLDAYRSAGRDVTMLSPALGVRVQPLAWEGLQLKARVGRAFRAPTFGERFSEPGGNPELKPEAGWSAETGAAVALHRASYSLTAELTAFASRLHHQIVWQPSYVAPGVQVWRPKNVARVATRGLEASLRGTLRLAPEAEVEGGFFFTHAAAEDRSNPLARSYGKQLPYVPRQRLKLFVGAAWGAFRLDLSGRLVGPRYTTSDETQLLPPYQVVDAHLRYSRTFGPVTAALGLAVKNLFDTDYGVVRFYPMPPRHARLHLTLSF